MDDNLPVTLSETDLEVLALMKQSDQQYQVYLEIMQAQAQVNLLLGKRHRIEASRSWDHPLGLVIRKGDYAVVERPFAGDRSTEK